MIFTAGEYVTPNTIIFRQRGSKWHPGENCHMGRDHTICASQPGYVRYYRNPRQHPDRKFIGVVLDAEDKLPYPRGAPRRRRLGLLAVPMKDANVVEETIMGMEDEDSGMRITGGKAVGTDAGEEAMVHAAPMEARARWPWQTYINTITPSTSSSVTKDGKKLNVKMKKDYSYGLSNYEIGRAAEHADVPKVQQFRRSRFIAWRKASARIANNAQMRAARRRTGAAKAKKKAKGPGKPRTRA